MIRLEGKRAFGAVMIGQIGSGIGSAMTCFGAAFWALAELGDATAYSVVLVMAILPVAIGAGVAGPFVDRWDRRWVMIIANVVSALATLIVAGLYFSGVLAMWHLYLLLFVSGFGTGFIVPALEASVPLLVPKEQLGRASGMVQLNLAVRIVVAPALAGIVLAGAGLGAILLIDAATFLLGVLGLAVSVIPRPKPSVEPGPAQANVRGYATAWRYLLRRPPLLYLMGLVWVTMLLMAGLAIALLTPLVLVFADERAAGLVVSCFGFGALVGGVLLGVWGGPKRRMNGIHATFFLGGVALAVIGIVESLAGIAIGGLIVGASSTSMAALIRVVWQVKVPADILGRIFALRVVTALVAQCVGMLLAVPLAERIFEPLMQPDGALATGLAGTLLGVGSGRGMGLLFFLTGVFVCVAATVCALLPATRQLEDRLPDVVES